MLSLLKQIDAICRENDIEYYLTAGTLIGALRHRGFIPWDDDADVIMTRNNWEKFLECTRGKLPEGIVLNTQYDDPNLAATANHFVDTRTTSLYRYDITNPERSGIMVDMIIMDPVPDTEEAKRDYVEALTKYTELTTMPYQYSLRIGKSTEYNKLLKMKNKVGIRKTLDYLTKKAFHYTEEESQYYVQRFAGSPHFWRKELLGKPKYVPFEDTMLPIPEHAEEYTCIGYADDWMNVPSNGPTKSTHEYNVGSLTIPGKYISDDFESRVDRREINKLFTKRKKIQVSLTDRKFKAALNSYKFAAERIKLLYKKKAKKTDYAALLEAKDYGALEEYFEDYISIQCTNIYIGSSSLEGWINWYRKCHPYLIDIGDNALYVALRLFEHDQKLVWLGKLVKARKDVNRPLTEPLKKIAELYDVIKQATYTYDAHDDKKCRSILDRYLPEYPDDPFLLKFDLKLKIRDGISGDDVIKRANELLEMFPEDAELMYFKADALIRKGETENGINIFRDIVEFSNHGIVLLNMKETVAAMFEKEPQNFVLAELWLKIRARMGEEDLPEIEELIPQDEEDDSDDGMSSDENIEADQIESSIPEKVNTENELIDSNSGGSDVMNNLADANDNEDDSNSIKPNDLSELSLRKYMEKDKPLTDVQQKRLELLCELRDICQANGIRYYLWGKGLLQAMRNKKFIDEDGDLAVVMTPVNCEKFMRAVKEENRADRFLDSMYDNPKFHRFCVRYGDTETLDFSPSQCSNPNSGIYVTIEILRNAATAKHKDFRNKFDQMLEAGWETRNTMKWTSVKRKISYFVVCVMCFFFGEKKTSRMLFKRFLKGPKRKDKGKYYLKPFWGKRTFFPSFWFSNVRGVKLENEVFITIKPCDLYLKRIFGAKWKTCKFPYTKINKYARIVDAAIPCKEYFDYLNSDKIDVNEEFRYKQITDRKYAPVMTMGAQTSHYWDIMCMCGERYRLYEEYMPKKLYLQELFRSNKIKLLLKELDDFYETALMYSKKGLGLCFDMKISDMLDYCLKVTGKGKQAAALRRLLTANDKKPIVLENLVEAKGMREAIAQEIPAILTYLKRSLADCLYMYIDIAKYGLENPNLKVWLDSNKNGIKFVMINYYSGISIQAGEDSFDPEQVANMIRQQNSAIIRGKRTIIEKLAPYFEDFTEEYGSVFKLTSYRLDNFDESIIETALPEDTPEIARLIKKNPEIGSYYNTDDLANQLAERIKTGTGRSYIIRENGKIIAHIASYAEFEGIASTGGLIVDPDYQKGIYGSILEGYLVRRLLKEKFTIYTFVEKRLRTKFLKSMGNQCVSEFGRLFKDAEPRENMKKKEEPSLDYPFNSELLLRKKKSVKNKLLKQENVKRVEKNIAILGGSTTNDIREMMEIFLLKEGIKPNFYESDYNKFWEDAMFGNPELDNFKPDLIFIHTSQYNIQHWCGASMSEERIAECLNAEYVRFRGAWNKLAEKFGCPIIQNNFDKPLYRLFGNSDIYDFRGMSNFVYRLNGMLYKYAREHADFHIHDIDYLSARYGLDNWQSIQHWSMYKYAFNLRAIPEFAYSVTRIIKSIFGKNKKALALDLDNTLWGGVVGDDGVDNLEIGPETPVGESFLAFQEYLSKIRDMGVLLTVNSKNDEENALAGLNHPNNILKPQDFALIKANWNSKDSNLIETAQQLNIGVDSIVFMDDNPAERDIVRSQLPSVAVPEVERAEEFIAAVDRAGFFEVTCLTADDLKRNDMYKANAERLEIQKTFANYDDYLRSLEMTAQITDFEPVNFQRIAQLINKTNQFNLTTKRISEAEIELIAKDDTYIRLSGRLVDKFGDNGIVSVVIGKKNGADVDIELWLMSCRVLKRGFEEAMFNELVRRCREENVTRIIGHYYPTAKNGMVKEFYGELGFTKLSEDEQGCSEWEFPLENHKQKNSIIKIN